MAKKRIKTKGEIAYGKGWYNGVDAALVQMQLEIDCAPEWIFTKTMKDVLTRMVLVAEKQLGGRGDC